MEITEVGKYRLLKELRVRGTNWIATLDEGSVITVTQIDKDGRKFYSPEIGDWHPNYFKEDVICRKSES